MIAAASPVQTLSIPYAEQATALARQYGIETPLEEQFSLFLETVWSSQANQALLGLSVETEYWSRRVSPPTWQSTVSTHWLWHDSLDSRALFTWAQAANTATYHQPGLGGIYWQTASRKHSVLSPGRMNARGSLDELVAVTSLYCDLDCAQHGYPLDQALAALLSLPLRPTFVVFSGGGLQAVHALGEPWSVLNREAAQEYKAYSLAFYSELYARTGLELDRSVHEASRMLRMPGLVNRKPARLGAEARLVYADPATRYTVDQIRSHAPLPTKPVKHNYPELPVSTIQDGRYQVGQDFVFYLVENAPTPPERHPVLLSLAAQAARARIPMSEYLARARPIASRWYVDNPHRAGDELNKLTSWCYERIAEDPDSYPSGGFLVELTATGFKLSEAVAQEALSFHDHIEPAKVDCIADDYPEIPKDVRPSLADVRVSQLEELLAYTTSPIPKSDGQRIGTYMLLRTPPGAGKSHTALNVAWQYAQGKGTAQGGRGKVAILTQFKLGEYAWQEWLTGFGLDGEAISCSTYIVERNPDQNSAGYCAQTSIADAVARKGYNTVHHVCKRCTLREQCESKGYLSQFKRAEHADMAIMRHQHGMIDQFVDYRRLLVFDESPLAVVGQGLTLKLDDLVFTPPPVVIDQHPTEAKLLSDFVEALRQVIAANTPLQGRAYPTEQHARLGGKWLYEKLDSVLGVDDLVGSRIRDLADIDVDTIAQSGQPLPFSLTLEDVAALPVNYLLDVWRIVVHEYETYYRRGAARWNSRLIPWGNTLRVYPMEPYAISSLSKVVVTDATGQPELYAHAFTDSSTGWPREAHVFETEVMPHATIVQFANSGNSRRALLRPRRAHDEPDAQPETESSGAALVRAKQQIAYLARKHAKSLLVVSYFAIHEALRTWCAENGTLDPDLVQYYYNLRGRNDYKSLEACLLIGEPRIPPMEVFAAAQVWHWNDPIPISFEADPVLKRIRYPGYTDPTDGLPREYVYQGYKDERLNRIYEYQITAEMRQCYERIRPNAPEIDPRTGLLQEKFIYLAAQIPCSDHVDVLTTWTPWLLDDIGGEWLKAQQDAGSTPTQAQYVKALKAAGQDYSDPTLRASADRVMKGGAKRAGDLVRDWANDPRHPERLHMTWYQAKCVAREIDHVSDGTWKREYAELQKGLPPGDQNENLPIDLYR